MLQRNVVEAVLDHPSPQLIREIFMVKSTITLFLVLIQKELKKSNFMVEITLFDNK